LKKRKKILIAQPVPTNLNSPFHDLAKKQNLKITFNPFIVVEGETVKNIRLKKINIPTYSALILTSRNAVNHYFRICDEMRITVPNSLKYFCISEAVSYYLQKYIAYRKRKIYSANNDFAELIDLMTKHENDKFLLVSSSSIKKDIIKQLNDSEINYTHGTFFKTVATDLSKLKLSSFEILVFYTPRDIDSLYQNFPDFEQGDIKIAVFGSSTYQLAIEKGLNVTVKAPSEAHPSMSMALNSYLNTAK
jgi:uroporphyrinogen-III synthase